MKYDAVVIGGGLGGLSGAAYLAKAGKKVLLLEQFARVGGYSTAWYKDGVTIEGVLHEIDDMGPNSFKADLLRELGNYNAVEFVKTNEFYRVCAKDVDFVLPEGIEEKKRALVDRFPEQKEGIERYFNVVDAISSEVMQLLKPNILLYMKFLLFPLFFRNILKYEKISVQEFFDACFTDEKIKIVLGANLGYYGDDPKKLPMLIFGVAQGSYYRGGGWFIKGGSQKFSDSFVEVIGRYGSSVETKADVVKILTKDGKATGVIYEKQGESHEVYADVILSNASPIWMLDAIDDKSCIKEQKKWLKSEISPSSFGLYIIVGGAVPQGRIYSSFIFGRANRFEKYHEYAYSEIEERGFNITDYGAIDSGLGSDGKRLVVVFITSKYEEWSELSREEYEKKKVYFSEVLLKRTGEIYPDIVQNLISYEAATPLTNERYTKNPHGAIYGYAQTFSQSGRHRGKYAKMLPNLFNASAWGGGGGYSGALYAGYQSAKSALKILK